MAKVIVSRQTKLDETYIFLFFPLSLSSCLPFSLFSVTISSSILAEKQWKNYPTARSIVWPMVWAQLSANIIAYEIYTQFSTYSNIYGDNLVSPKHGKPISSQNRTTVHRILFSSCSSFGLSFLDAERKSFSYHGVHDKPTG